MLRNAYGAAILAAAVSGGVAACGSLDNGSNAGFTPSGDAGSGQDATASDTGAPFGDGSAIGNDGAGPQGDSGAPLQTGALFVHASPDVVDLRLCWYVGPTPDAGEAPYSSTEPPFPSGTPAPASNYPALPIGGAVPLPDASELLGGDLHMVGIGASLLSMLAPNPLTPKDCHGLLSGSQDALGPTVTLFHFDLPQGRVVAGATNVIALAGCPPNDMNLMGASDAAILARCGPGYMPSNGNLRLDVVPLYEVAEAGAGQLPVQAAQLSPALAQLAGDGGAVVVSFGAQGATSPVASLTSEGAFAPSAAAYLDAGTDPHNYGTLGFGVDIPGATSGPGHLWMSLEQSLSLQGPTIDPSLYYAQQTTYVVAIVGDPSSGMPFMPDASFDGTGLHVLVLPLP